MITEQEREKSSNDKLLNAVQLCKETLEKAEKYERLKDNADWKGFWTDIDVLIGLHEREISNGISFLPDAPNTTYLGKEGQVVSSKADWTDFISRHEIQRMELSNWKKEPERILKMAALAREKLPLLEEELRKSGAHEPVEPRRRNGVK